MGVGATGVGVGGACASGVTVGPPTGVGVGGRDAAVGVAMGCGADVVTVGSGVEVVPGTGVSAGGGTGVFVGVCVASSPPQAIAIIRSSSIGTKTTNLGFRK